MATWLENELLYPCDLNITKNLSNSLNIKNRTITTVVNELLNECEVAVDLMLNAYEQIEKGVDQQKVLTNMLADGFGIVSDKLKDD